MVGDAAVAGLGVMVNPAGSEPLCTKKGYGGSPPAIMHVVVYFTPTVTGPVVGLHVIVSFETAAAAMVLVAGLDVNPEGATSTVELLRSPGGSAENTGNATALIDRLRMGIVDVISTDPT